MQYRKATHEEQKDHRNLMGESKVVVPWKDGTKEGIVFRCPCGKRLVYVTSPPHTIDFDKTGLLTIKGSVGSRKGLQLIQHPKDFEAPENWCHFAISNGYVTMYDDSGCPGRDMAVIESDEW